MNSGYDMCLDYDVLCEIDDKLQKIRYDLVNSSDQMVSAMKECKGYLAGNQFEKAKSTTNSCIDVSRRTVTNITNAIKYIEKLERILMDYGNCAYSEES